VWRTAVGCPGFVADSFSLFRPVLDSLKDWAEILHTQKNFEAAEEKIRLALELLENHDSDALFTLGVILSEQGRHEEAIDAYRQSVALNAEDAELCFNLGTKLGETGKTEEEMDMYDKATRANPNFGAAWLNWGTSLGESGNLDDAEAKFIQALQCETEVIPKAMLNLAFVYQKRGEALAIDGDLQGAKVAAVQASRFADQAKPLLDELAKSFRPGQDDITAYLDRYSTQRVVIHRLLGQIYAGTGNMGDCEAEFRRATESFPNEAAAWQMLGRVLEIQGKADEAAAAAQKAQELRRP